MGLTLSLAFFNAVLIIIVLWVIDRSVCEISRDFSQSATDVVSPWNILQRPHRKYTRVNVLDFGAQGDGVSDDSQAFLDAWSEACNLNYSILIIPENTYLLQPTEFAGPCGLGMKIQLDGTLVAPHFNNWTISLLEYSDSDDDPLDYSSQLKWLSFAHLDGVVMQGAGGFDGEGKDWWEQSCKVNRSNPCHSAPAAVTFSESNNTVIRNLNFRNSPQMHLILDKCSVMRLVGLNVQAPGKSPNTDGIHLHASENIVIQDCIVSTGDDCISIQTGSSNVRIKKGYCGPGHGISIGSLGKNGGTAAVSAVIVDGAVLNGSTNGLRIKTWQGGHGSVNNIRYKNVKMINVSYPIIIDQYYCDSRTPCKNETSAVEVSDILYRNVSGTSATPVAVKFACSDTVGCHGIVVQDVFLTGPPKTRGNASSFCENASGIVRGNVTPPMCV